MEAEGRIKVNGWFWVYLKTKLAESSGNVDGELCEKEKLLTVVLPERMKKGTM